MKVTRSGAAGTLRWWVDTRAKPARLYWLAWSRDTGVVLRVTTDGDRWAAIPLPDDAGRPTDVTRFRDAVVVLTERWPLQARGSGDRRRRGCRRRRRSRPDHRDRDRARRRERRRRTASQGEEVALRGERLLLRRSPRRLRQRALRRRPARRLAVSPRVAVIAALRARGRRRYADRASGSRTRTRTRRRSSRTGVLTA